MIRIIFGPPGCGKSSLNTYFLIEEYRKQGSTSLADAKKRIAEANAERAGAQLECPEKPPIYCDYNVRYYVGNKVYYEPYFINGFYFGLPNGENPVLAVPPGAFIHLSEAQRYYDSRKSMSGGLPDWVSRAYEIHRHYFLTITMDVQRPGLIDVNIRELCKCFIEVQRMEQMRNACGVVEKTIFYCREFNSWAATENYIANGGNDYNETTYMYDGDIYRCFDSYIYFKEFLPQNSGFDYLGARATNQAEEQYRKFRAPDYWRKKGVK